MNLRTLLLLGLLASCISINPIVIKGRKFFDSVTRQQFYIKGVDYQPSGDPIADIAGLQRDIPYMQQLGINTIRCYQTDYTQNHDAGMQLLAQAGIYALIDLSDPQFSINAYPPDWTTTLFDNFRKKASAFSQYTNTLGFISANEVILPAGSTTAAAFVKAAIRDVKAWLKSIGQSKPVGYAAADVAANDQLQPFLDCSSADESADFYGVNIYRWCGDSNFQASGYNGIVSQYASYSIPYIFTEFGCNTVNPRPFTEIQAIYGPEMDDVISGGLVYEWHQDVNNYGLVSISADGSSLTLLQDFQNLKAQYASVHPTIANMDSYTPTEGLSACPAVTSDWLSAAEPLPQTPNLAKCQCMFQQLSCRLSAEVFNPATISLAESNALGNAQTTVCNENGQWCWPTGVAPQYPSYGIWSDCNEYEKLSYVINTRFLAHNSDPSTCSYSGLSTVIVTPTVSSGTNCQAQPNTYAFENGGSSNSATSSSGSSSSSSGTTGATGGSSGCGANTLACGTACYSPSQYCCQNNNLMPLSQCGGSQATATTSQNSVTPSQNGGTSTSQGGSPNTNPVVTSNTEAVQNTVTQTQSGAANPSTNSQAVNQKTTSRVQIVTTTTEAEQLTNTVFRAQSNSSGHLKAFWGATVLCVGLCISLVL